MGRASTARLDVAPLELQRAARSELEPAPVRLVVEVREAVLMQADAGVAALELGRQRGAERGRDHREVNRQPVLGEHVEQGAQAVVAPADVVVAEEDGHGSRRRVERRPDRMESHRHLKHVPVALRDAPRRPVSSGLDGCVCAMTCVNRTRTVVGAGT
jgi:hypothetical protein